MRIILNADVITEAQKRISYLFDEFEEIVLSYSGGKDSSVVFDLTYKEAQKRGKELYVVFLDQEAEYKQTEEMVKYIRSLPGVKMLWFQIPFNIFNASSHLGDEWLECWKPGDKWIREKDPKSIHNNELGVDRFGKIFPAILKTYFKDKKVCYIAGVRAEESPARLLGTTRALTYKHITWGKVLNKNLEHYTFYPVYDWTYKDVWKYIYSNKVKYNKVYDYMYQFGEPINKMRVSNLNHETALHHINFLKEIDTDLYNKLADRLEGISTYNKLEEYLPDTLPTMFGSWEEYRDYLVENLVQKEEQKEKFFKRFKAIDKKIKGYETEGVQNKIIKSELKAIIRNDYHSTTLSNLLVNIGKIGGTKRKQNLISNK